MPLLHRPLVHAFPPLLCMLVEHSPVSLAPLTWLTLSPLLAGPGPCPSGDHIRPSVTPVSVPQLVVYPSFLPQTGPVHPKLGTPAPRQIKLVVLVGQASQAKEEEDVIVETLAIQVAVALVASWFRQGLVSIHLPREVLEVTTACLPASSEKAPLKMNSEYEV